MKCALTIGGAAFLVLAARTPVPAPPTLYLFFTLDTPDLARTLRDARRAAGSFEFRPVFLPDRRLPEDFGPDEEVERALAEAGQDVLVIDTEGLDLARRFGVRSTPTAVWTGRGIHRSAGTRIDWKELIACGR